MLIDQIIKDMKTCMSNQENEKKAFLSVIRAEAEMCGKKKGAGNRPPTDEEVIKIIKTAMDTAKVMITNRQKRNEGIQKELTEISILENYLPKQLSEEELKNAIAYILSKMSEPKKIGAVMAELQSKFSGSYDGKLANVIIKNSLG